MGHPFAFFVLAVVCTAGCFALGAPEQGGEPSPPGLPDTTAQNVISGLGTIAYQDLEGGFYGLLADDGTTYYPFNLAAELREDNLRVRFRLRRRTDVMSIVMWGILVEVLEIERVETPR